MEIKIVNKNSPKIANKGEAKLEMEKHQTHESVKTGGREEEEKRTTE